MADGNLHQLGEEYQQLRQTPNQKDKQERKYQVMNTIVEQLGLPGTPAADILSTLGKPDEMTPLLQHEVAPTMMPGPVIDDGHSTTIRPPYYFVYYCQGKQDYYYFKIDSVKETVITSDWHHEK
ncbi:uncharacterized protein BX664DRAFT_331644 [Halteromyces radiatus]|uniref:uncharacterized protein n=1 Tax=Halteromyces radiatus TaxID=101107 RepID=UPI00221EA39B|nr:uncharacterized protein BX664DRAFT_331644 [Halteromyces radiatus]KAI8088878.1 hypothetical protein BX664DRAFT_331644 [Halteromyces radiatus]